MIFLQETGGIIRHDFHWFSHIFGCDRGWTFSSASRVAESRKLPTWFASQVCPRWGVRRTESDIPLSTVVKNFGKQCSARFCSMLQRFRSKLGSKCSSVQHVERPGTQTFRKSLQLYCSSYDPLMLGDFARDDTAPWMTPQLQSFAASKMVASAISKASSSMKPSPLGMAVLPTSPTSFKTICVKNWSHPFCQAAAWLGDGTIRIISNNIYWWCWRVRTPK